MCGILGFIGPRSFDATAFGRALDVMQARGPDDRGIYEEPECLLGHRRLAILDLSPSGHQPMSTPDGRYTIVFNGEVYNYRELRKPLEDEGLTFHSTSDTEVILALYAREGPECVTRFRGMFALAIWDALDKALFLARDRMGIKPLYLWPRPGGLGFASELKAIRALPGGPSEIKPEAVAAYLAWGSVPEPKTVLKGVDNLGPGTWARWSANGFRSEPYWRGPDCRPTIRRKEEAVELLRPIVKEAVALRCISDAPLGAFLSGGVDSSSVVALMRAAGQSDLHTFSISFPQTAWDEGPYALKVAESFDTLHTDVSVTEHMVRSELDGFFGAMDQPTCDGVNTYLVSKFARQGGLTVSLSGLGGDELFAGYGTFRRIRNVAPLMAHFPRPAAWLGGAVAGRLRGRYAKLEALGLRGSTAARLYYGSRGVFMPTRIRQLLHPDIESVLGKEWSPLMPYGEEAPGLQSLIPSAASPLNSVHTTIALELGAYMRNQLLRDSDVFGMANSLEIRVPLIDHKLVEAVFSIHEDLLLEAPVKSLLLDALPVPLPPLCTHRPKMGFTFPFDAWLKGPWELYAQEALRSGPSEVLDSEAILDTWQSYLSGRGHWSRPWTLLALNRAMEGPCV
jgi:asparagine synthase (glutamine-hydrolysing)